MKSAVRCGIVALLSLALVACANVATEPTVPEDDVARAAAIAARDARLASLDTYRVGGGFGYWDDRQNLTADIEWRHAPERLDIALVAPLGLGRLSVEQTPGAARVVRSGQAPRTGRDAGTLLQNVLGLAVPVPIDRLSDWIRGLPGAGATQVERDDDGRLASLVWRDGTGTTWRARVRRYRSVDGLDLPALLTARSGERHLKLALKDWALDAGPSTSPDAEPAVDPATSPSGRRLSLPGE